MCKLCGIWRMKDWSYAGLDGCRTGWIQNRMDAGQDGCRTGWIQYRMDALQFGCTTARMHYRNDAGQGWCSTGGMQDRMDARQDRQDWSDATSFSAALLSHWPIKLQNWLFSSRKKVHDRMHEKLDVRVENWLQGWKAKILSFWGWIRRGRLSDHFKKTTSTLSTYIDPSDTDDHIQHITNYRHNIYTKPVHNREPKNT